MRQTKPCHFRLLVYLLFTEFMIDYNEHELVLNSVFVFAIVKKIET